MTTLALFGLPGWQELIILVAMGLLVLFGHRIPRLAHSLGLSAIEFKRGLSDSDKIETPKIENASRK